MGEESEAQQGKPWDRSGAKRLLGGLQVPKHGASVVQGCRGSGHPWRWGPPGDSSLAEVKAEDWAGEHTLLQHALQGCGGPTRGQGRVGHAHDAIELRIDKIGAWLVLTQTELLVGDLDALDLEGDTKVGR